MARVKVDPGCSLIKPIRDRTIYLIHTAGFAFIWREGFLTKKIINCFLKPLLTSISFINSSSDSTVIINYILRLQLSITRQEQNDSSRGSVRQLTCCKLVVHYIFWRKYKERSLVNWLCMLQVRGLLLQHRHNQSVLHSWSCCVKIGQVYSWNAITYSGRRLNVTRDLRDVMSLLEALYLLWSI